MLRGASLRVIKTFVSIIIGFMMMPFLINHLGNHLYGLWITVGSVVAAYYLLDLGFSQAVTRYVAKCIHQNDFPGANKIINTALAIYSILALLIVVLSIVLTSTAVERLVENPQDLKLVQALVLITGVALAFEFPSKAFPGIINAYMRYDTTAIVALIKTIVDAICIYLFIKNGYGLLAMALISFVTGMLSTAFYAYYCNQLFKQLEYSRRNIDFETTKEIFHFSKWVFVIDANRLLKEKMDVWLIALYGSASLVTIYYVAVRLVEYAIQFLVQATGMASTLFTKYYALGDHQKLAWAVNVFIKINFLLSLIFLNGFYLVGREFIGLWMGKDFKVDLAYQCLIILSLGKMATYASAPIGGLLLTIKKHSFSAKLSIVETAISAGLCIWLIPAYGLPGAAVAISAPLLVSRILVLPIYAQKQLQYMNVYLLLRLVIAALISLAAAYLLKKFVSKDSSIVEILIMSLSYSCLLPVLCLILFDRPELEKVKGLLVKKFKK
jgi:O-antigen/teichoic acid export membrane protein